MTELVEQSVKELRKKAQDLNIKKWYSLKKAELIMALESFKITTPIVDVPPLTANNATAEDLPPDSSKRTVSWIILITLVTTVPLLAWWISQPSSSWYQPVLDFFKF